VVDVAAADLASLGQSELAGSVQAEVPISMSVATAARCVRRAVRVLTRTVGIGVGSSSGQA